MTELAVMPLVRAATLQFELDAEKGVFHLSSPETGRRVASGLECAARMDGDILRSAGTKAVWRPLPDTEGGGIEVEFNAGQDIQLGLVVRSDGLTGGLVFRLRVTNTGRTRILNEAAVITTGDNGVLDFCPGISDSAFFETGWQGWDTVRTWIGGGRASEPGGIASSMAAAVGDSRSGAGLILGFADATTHFGAIRLSANQGSTRLEAVMEADHSELAEGSSIISSSLWVSFGPSPALLLFDYHRFRAPLHRAHALPVAWDSWHVHYEDTTEKEFIESLEALRTRFPEVDTVILGDGYQKIHADGPGIGDWLETNPRFPHGLAWLSEQIKRRGLRPGIWTAPFLVGERCEFYKYYPDALVRNRTDSRASWREMWRGDRVYYLDTTHPDGRNFIREVFEQLSYRFGFQAFEVGFAYAAAAEGFRRDLSATRADALHRGIELVRRTVGDDCTILLSGSPPGAGDGLVDAVRSTPDNGPHWLSRCGPRAVSMTALGRSFLGGASDMAAAPVLIGAGANSLSDDEFRFMASALGLAGGPVTVSGPVAAFAQDRADILRRILPGGGHNPAVALDLLQRPDPQVFAVPVLHTGGASWMVGVFNSEEQAAERSLDLRKIGAGQTAFHVYDAWNHQDLGTFSDIVPLGSLPPHSCRLLAVQAGRGEPQVIAIGERLLQGSAILRRTHWQPAGANRPGVMHVELANPGSNRLHVHCVVPPGLLPRSARAHSGKARINREKSGSRLLTVETSFRDHCSFDILF